MSQRIMLDMAGGTAVMDLRMDTTVTAPARVQGHIEWRVRGVKAHGDRWVELDIEKTEPRVTVTPLNKCPCCGK